MKIAIDPRFHAEAERLTSSPPRSEPQKSSGFHMTAFVRCQAAWQELSLGLRSTGPTSLPSGLLNASSPTTSTQTPSFTCVLYCSETH